HSKYRTKDPNFNQIERVHKKALKLLQRLPFRRHMNVAVSMSNLGLIRLCQGECESASEIFMMARDYLSKCPGK
ncbi:tetratricopeptide repeat protein, partial [Klebsiella pneumoniae]